MGPKGDVNDIENLEILTLPELELLLAGSRCTDCATAAACKKDKYDMKYMNKG
jgi:hypothetical protein